MYILSARLETLTDKSVIILSGKQANRPPFVFLNAEDEKTLESFKVQIVNFFVDFLESSESDAENYASEIVNVRGRFFFRVCPFC